MSPQAFSQPTGDEALDRLLAGPWGTHLSSFLLLGTAKERQKNTGKLSEHFLGDVMGTPAEIAGQCHVSQQCHWGYNETLQVTDSASAVEPGEGNTLYFHMSPSMHFTSSTSLPVESLENNISVEL